jgi:cysteine-rich repeat protein
MMPTAFHFLEMPPNALHTKKDTVSFKVVVCGDLIWVLPNEECDDGNTVNGDGCDSTCQIEQRNVKEREIMD